MYDKIKGLRLCSAVLAILSTLLYLTGCDTDFLNSTAGVPSDGLNIHMIDVGQGDSFLLECSGEYMLIDAGESDSGSNVAEYLKEHNVDRLEYAVVTHPHSDHYGGMLAVLEDTPAENFVISKRASTTRMWEKLIDYADSSSNIVFPDTNDTFSLGECTVTAFMPDAEYVENTNDASIVLRADYDGMSALFMGDAEKSEEDQLIKSGFNISADVLKLGHHGSSTSTGAEFIKKVDPSLALISCGENNEYGHPSRKTTETLRKCGVYSRRTDKDGSVVVNMCGGKITVITADGDSSDIMVNNSSNSNETTSSLNSSEAVQSGAVEYIGNKNSKVFHSKDCGSVKKMSDKNKILFESREEAVSSGYSPCGSCKP